MAEDSTAKPTVRPNSCLDCKIESTGCPASCQFDFIECQNCHLRLKGTVFCPRCGNRLVESYG